MQSTCERCNRTFEHATGNRRRFCSQECRKAGPIAPVGDLFCEQCGSEITRDKRPGKRFCSQSCFGEWNSIHKVGENHPLYAKVERVCEQCKIVFLTSQCEIKKGWGRFCSHKCHHDSGRVECECKQCGKAFTDKKARANNGRGIFCSKNCMTEWQKVNPPDYVPTVPCGEDHPRWKGGHVGYYGPNWYTQRRLARKRDNYKCQCCGVDQKRLNKSLEVHHVKPFRQFGYIPGENSNYLAANDLTNLLSLCPRCHKLAEWGSIPVQPVLL